MSTFSTVIIALIFSTFIFTQSDVYATFLSKGISDQFTIKGITTGYSRKIERKKDGFIDLSLVLPALLEKDLLSFNISHILSPTSDEVDLGIVDFEVPSNLSLPKQRESYVIPFTVDKPSYQFSVSEPGEHVFTAVHGQFNIKTVIDKVISGSPIFELFNDFKFIDAGQVKTVFNTEKTAEKDIKIKEYKITEGYNFIAPEYKNGKTLFSFALNKLDTRFIPTDLKFFAPSSQLELKFADDTFVSKENKLFMSILMDDISEVTIKIPDPEEEGQVIDKSLFEPSFKNISVQYSSAAPNFTPTFLAAFAKPTLDSANKTMTMTPPEPLDGMDKVSTIVNLIEFKSFRNGKIIQESSRVLWSTNVDGWQESVTILDVNKIERAPDKKYRFEIIFVGHDNSSFTENNAGDQPLEFTHLTKNYLELE